MIRAARCLALLLGCSVWAATAEYADQSSTAEYAEYADQSSTAEYAEYADQPSTAEYAEYADQPSTAEYADQPSTAEYAGYAERSSTVQSPRRAERWSEQAANDWYAKQPWLVGSNYIPATAINELEMWQAESFDARRIDTELGWAESLGLNTMRVFLHDLPWQADPAGFRARIETFLGIADKHHIRPLFVLFDSVWDPDPRLGPQHPPTPGVHNSGWLQSPGAKALQDPAQYPRLEAYVKGVVGAFANDTRILGWDLWNEPDNVNTGSYHASEPKNKVELVLALLPRVVDWTRAARPSQPLTTGVWKGDWSSPDTLSPMERLQLESSDVISFHNYGKPEEFEKRVLWLQRYRRPILCTEYMARGNGSTFQGTLPIAKKHNVGAINWGLVAGKTQTHLPWDSWKRPYTDREPAVWFHEIFRTDGMPYRPEEADFIRRMIQGTDKSVR